MSLDSPPSRGPSSFNGVVASVFFLAGAAAFLRAWTMFGQEQSAIHQLLTTVTALGGVLCWGIAWIGAVVDDKA